MVEESWGLAKVEKRLVAQEDGETWYCACPVTVPNVKLVFCQ